MKTTPPRRTGRFVLQIGALAGLVGCSGLQADRALPQSFGSAEALVAAVLTAVAEGDPAAMQSYVVTRDEHRELFWDQLPESNHLPFDYARGLTERNSSKGIGRAIELFGGQEFEFVSLSFADEDTEAYEGFTFHFVKELVVRRSSDGAVGSLLILDVVVERDGRWKLMNYDEL